MLAQCVVGNSSSRREEAYWSWSCSDCRPEMRTESCWPPLLMSFLVANCLYLRKNRNQLIKKVVTMATTKWKHLKMASYLWAASPLIQCCCWGLCGSIQIWRWAWTCAMSTSDCWPTKASCLPRTFPVGSAAAADVERNWWCFVWRTQSLQTVWPAFELNEEYCCPYWRARRSKSQCSAGNLLASHRHWKAKNGFKTFS